MNQSNQSSIRNYFKIHDNEDIYDDFSCSLQANSLSKGRLYLTENHLCFSSNILGSSIKLNIKFSNISEIKKIQNKSISIILNHEFSNQEYKFMNFTNIEKSFSRISKIWKNTQNNQDYDNRSDDSTMNEAQTCEGSSLMSKLLNSSKSNKKTSDEEDILFKPLNQESIEIGRYIIHCSAEKVINNFFEAGSDCSLLKFYNEIGYDYVKLSDWKTTQENNTKSREIYFSVKIKHIPFFKSSSKLINQKLIKESEKIKIVNSISTFGFPFSANIVEIQTLEFLPYGIEKCGLRISILKNSIERKELDQSTNEMYKWIEFIKKHGAKIHEISQNIQRRNFSFDSNKEKNLLHNLEKNIRIKEPVLSNFTSKVFNFLLLVLILSTILLFRLTWIFEIQNSNNRKIKFIVDNLQLRYNENINFDF